MIDVRVTSERTTVDLRGARHFDHDLIEALDDALTRAEEATSAALEFTNTGDDFLVGIDARWVVDRMLDDDLPAIVDFVKKGQAFLRRLDATPCRTIARVHGHVTGAGAEWVSACDAVVADGDLRIGLPETGLGIHPALGGTQRVPRRIGRAAARWLVLTGEYLDAPRARALGWIDADTDGTRAARRLVPADRPGDPVVDAFAHRTLDALLDGPRDEDPASVRAALRRLARRAPTALRVADTLLARAATAPLEDGLEAEVDALPVVYATADALAGMRAGAAGRRAARFRRR